MMFLTAEQIRFQKSCAKASLGYSSAITAASGVAGNQILSFWLDAMVPGGAASVTRSRGTREWGQSRRRPVSRVKRGPRAWGQSERGGVAVRGVVGNPLANGGGGSGALSEAMESWFAMGQTMATAMGGGKAQPFGGKALPFGGTALPFGGTALPFGGTPVGGQMPVGMDPAAMMGAWFDMDWSRAPASWPMAYGMMSMGVPKEVACPMAEANLAMMEAFGIANEMTGGPGSSRGAAFQPFAMPDSFGGPDFFKGKAGRHSADTANPFAPAFADMFFKF